MISLTSFFITAVTLLSLLFHEVKAVTLAAQPRCVARSRHHTTRYDNIPYTENGSSNALPDPYLGLLYQNFSIASEANNMISASSGTQYAISYGGTGLIASSSNTTATGPTFSLLSFSYACDSGIPQPACKILLTGTKARLSPSSSPSLQTIQTSFVFPKLDPGHRIGEFVMNSTVRGKQKVAFGREWEGLVSLGWSIERASDGGDMFGALVLDDFEYVIESTGRGKGC